MKETKVQRKERGITLIALVVTIIVLLILAGISIAMLTGQTGILTQAQQAREQTEIGQVKDYVKQDLLEEMTKNRGEDITAKQLHDVLEKYFTNVPDLPEEGESYKGTVWENFPDGFPDESGKLITKKEYGRHEIEIGDIYSGNLSGTEMEEPPTPPIPETESYVGCYADIEGDGEIDGIIYADLAVGGNGVWNGDEEGWGDYAYEPKSGLKSYVEGEEVTLDKFNNVKAKVIKPKEESTGEDRFYVMALEDVDNSSHYWYCNAAGNLDNLVDSSENDLGAGKKNTEDMIRNWNLNGKTEGDVKSYGKQNTNDMWGIIQDSKINKKYSDLTRWFVPSISEWSAFGDMLWTNFRVTTSTYSNFNLKDRYWSSSQRASEDAWSSDFDSGGIYESGVTDTYYVRLSTTF